jgi:2-methylcitrate dehydratase PrpD
MQGNKINLQSKAAKFISELRYEALPIEIVENTKYRILDWLGSALAGISYHSSRIVTDLVKSNGGAPRATVLKGKAKVPVSQAAFANGVIGHVAEFDDGHRLAIAHPGAVTVPTALAVAEGYNRSGKELLTAIVAGYEVLIRLGMAINPSHYKIWHATGTCGAFAAAASAASLLKLDHCRVQMAIGITGTMASGLQETFGTYAKPLNAGHACQNGIQAALLAQNGFTGPEDILLGGKGFIRATSSDYNTKPLEEIGESPLLVNTAFFKVYASCGHTNSPLDAMFKIMEKHDLPLHSIRQVQVGTYRIAVDLTGELKNNNEDEAKFSLPYCLAVALVCKKVTLKEFAADKLNDPAILEIARKIKVVEDPLSTSAFPKRKATIRIELENNQVIEESVNNSNDTPQYDVLEEKFLSLAADCFDRPAAQRMRDVILNIEKLDNLNMLMRDLG